MTVVGVVKAKQSLPARIAARAAWAARCASS